MTLQYPLAGKIAIITGASRGIGAGVAEKLARRGAKVVITYTSPSSLPQVNDLISRINAFGNTSSAISIAADLCDPASPQKIVDATIEKFGAIDILINNAGREVVKPLGSITPEDFQKVYSLNVLAPILLTQAILPHLRHPGRIINISSVGARSAFHSLSLYCSSKAALESLTRCYATELGKKGTTVNAVAPGPIQTELLDNIPQEIVQMQKDNTPVENRVGTIAEVTSVVAWLAGEESKWVSGQVLNVSGGWTMY